MKTTKSVLLQLFKPITAICCLLLACQAQAQKSTPYGVFALLENDWPLQGPAPTYTPDAVWTNPNIAGVAIRTSWAVVQPDKAVPPNWGYLDLAQQLAQTYHKKLAIQIHAGGDTPQWVYKDGAYAFPITGVGPAGAPWDLVFQSDWGPFIDAFAAHCDSWPELAYVTMGGQGRAEESYWCKGPADEALLAKLNGGSPGYPLWVGGANWICDRYYSKFLTTPVCFATGAPVSGPDGLTAMTQVITHGMGNGTRFGIKSDGLSPMDKFSPAIGNSLVSLSGTAFSGFQMSLSYGDYMDLQNSFNTGAAYSPHMTEVYRSDCLSTGTMMQSTIAGYNTQLLLPPPVNLTAAHSSIQITLTWAPRPAASTTTYNVYRGATQGTETFWKPITGNSTTDSESLGITEYYVLKATDGTNEGPATPEVGATVSHTAVQVAQPTFNLVNNALFTGAQAVTISSATSSANLSVTTNNSTPTRMIGTFYTSPVTITLNGTTPLKAMAWIAGGPLDSVVASNNYTISPAPPGNVVAVGGNNSATLSWNGDTSDAVYTVLTDNGTGNGTYSFLTNTTNTTYTNSPLTNGTQYSYIIQGVNMGNIVSDNSSTVSATANPPSFTVTVSPTAQMGTAGATLNYTATVTAVNGFTGNVSLSDPISQAVVTSPVTLGDWPAHWVSGNIVTLNSTQTSADLMLNQTISSTAASPSAISDIVTGTSGNIVVSSSPVITSHFAPGTPPFTVAWLDPVSVQNGNASETRTYTLNISTNSSGFNGTINLTNVQEVSKGTFSLSGWPVMLGANSVTLNSAHMSQNVTLNQTTGGTPPPGSAVADIVTASAGSMSVTSNPAITTHFSSPNFALYVSPPSQSGGNGTTLTYNVTAGGSANYNQTVTLSNGQVVTQGVVSTSDLASDWPATLGSLSTWATASSGNGTIATTTLTQTIGSNATQGGGIADSVTGTHTTNNTTAPGAAASYEYPPFFTVSVAPSAQSGPAGHVVTCNVQVSTTNGFVGTINLTNNQTVTGGLSWLPATLSPSSVTLSSAQSSATVTLNQTIPMGAMKGTDWVSDAITGTSGSTFVGKVVISPN